MPHPSASVVLLATCLSTLSLGVLSKSFAAEEHVVRFDRDVRPILSGKCIRCHGPDSEHRKSDLRLDREDVAKKIAIVPGNPQKSELVARITTADPDMRMPPPDANKQLTPEEIETLTRWIDEGANWSRHWSFIASQAASRPEVAKKAWPRNEIDHFVLARLEHEGLAPSPEADRPTLIRRVTLDLTGLPPKLEEVDAFLEDRSPNAYQRVVDRLLCSPRYGERMAAMWLDLARYGDTSVYHQDGAREMWAWRDGVVDAYNANTPFDDFSIEQLAGDLLPNASLSQRIASGFNRNNGTTDEGGLIEEEYRVEYAVDRVKTTAMTWLGLTMECAQCHDHKYDPISQEDYYRFFAFFNISGDRGKQTSARNAPPLVEILAEENEKKLPGLVAKRAELKAVIEAHPAKVEPELRRWLADLEKKLSDPDAKFDPRDAAFHLPLDETEGEFAKDNVRPERSNRVAGEPKWTPAKIFGGLRFVDGGTTFIESDDVGGFERDQPFTLSLWLHPVKDDQGKDSQGSLIARIEDEDSFRGYELYYQTNQRLYVQLAHNAKSNAIRVRSEREIQWNTWQHVCVTYDGSSSAGGVRFYVDGEPWSLKGEQDNLTESIRTEKPLRVGSRPGGFRPIGILDEVRVFSRALQRDEILALFLRDTVATAVAADRAETNDKRKETLLDYYLWHVDDEYQALNQRAKKLEEEEQELRRPKTTVMVMADQGKPRATYVLRRGAYDDRTDRKVQPGFPGSLPPLPPDAPRNRLGLAKWLFQPENPLTARVAVNRYWQMLFGAGLVATPGDFGSQGEFPSYPNLLDWLASDFRDHGWDVKRTLRTIVSSATYRQSSSASRQLYDRDPQNRLLARGARFRLQAEFLRDNALSLSGLLVDKMGGPGVKPYQPEGLWKEILQGGDRPFVQDHGQKLYRRSVYTYWRRTCPPPNMRLFDAPTREKCVVRRSLTNTPLQALVTLNDMQYMEAARHFAERMFREGGHKPEDRIAWGFQLATSRKLRENELAALLDVYRHSRQHYDANSEAALKLISIGESSRDESLDPVEHAATTIVASMLLNLDETLTRE